MKERYRPEMTSFMLHMLAMICMLCDHLWGTSFVQQDVFTVIGRLAFPIYAFLTVEGYFHTADLRKYVLRLLAFALLSEIPFNLMMGSSWFYPIHQNVLWSFLIAIGLMHWNEKMRKKQAWKRVLVGCTTICIAYVGGILTFVDYNHAGLLMVLTFYFFRGRKWWHYLGQLICMWYINCEMLGGFGYEVEVFGTVRFIARQSFALLSLIPIWLYRGRQGYYSKALQWGYYMFYPLHMLVLSFAKML